MFEITGKYNTAKVFTDDIEATAIAQIQNMMNYEFCKDSKIRIMPDVHAGKGCTIGTTMTITDKVVPNIVGVDISCGMEVVILSDKRMNLPELDSFIHKDIPSGFNVRSKPHRGHGRIHIEDELRCYDHIDCRRIYESLGTLGGGNHFIEVDHDDDDNLYIVIHSGSRNLGKQVAEYYQKVAYEHHGGKSQKEIPYELAWLEGEDLDNYLNDMKVLQEYASLNRRIMADEIIDNMKLHEVDRFTTLHNYIDLDAMILRKGSVSANSGERLIIPMNMRDGSLICTGLGNEDWNYSAPHGAGRIMSRTQAKNSVSMTDFKQSMEGIFTTSVSKDTLDESPMVYKPMEEIISCIGDTVTIDKIIKPIYNFKAGGRD